MIVNECGRTCSYANLEFLRVLLGHGIVGGDAPPLFRARVGARDDAVPADLCHPSP